MDSKGRVSNGVQHAEMLRQESGLVRCQNPQGGKKASLFLTDLSAYRTKQIQNKSAAKINTDDPSKYMNA